MYKSEDLRGFIPNIMTATNQTFKVKENITTLLLLKYYLKQKSQGRLSADSSEKQRFQ